MQLFRLMGMPDKMIAFNELPDYLLEGLEMVDESRLPRHWRDFIGKRKKSIRIAPDRDPITGQMRTYQPLVMEAPYSYSIDWEINANKDRWSEIQAYVRQHAPVAWKQTMTNGETNVKLTDKLEDLAVPMASDAHSELNLEPEDVPVVPLEKVAQETQTATVTLETFKCDQCNKEFDKKQALSMHKTRVHKPQEAQV